MDANDSRWDLQGSIATATKGHNGFPRRHEGHEVIHELTVAQVAETVGKDSSHPLGVIVNPFDALSVNSVGDLCPALFLRGEISALLAAL